MTNTRTSARGALLPWIVALIVLLGLPATFGSLSTSTYGDDDAPEKEAPDEEAPEEEVIEEETVEEEPASELPWILDIAQATTRAAEEGKDLFINFAGSDWCGYCRKLDEEVFDHAEFIDATDKDYVFLYLDFPRRDEEAKAKVVDPAMSEKWRDLYGVGGFPTIILATAQGAPYARIGGYQPGGPTVYLENLAKLRKAGEAVKKLLADEKHEDVKALEAAFPVLASNNLLDYPDYKWTLEAAEKADPEGDLGLLPLVQAERERQLLEAEEADLIALLQESPGGEPDPDVIMDFVLKSKHLAGPRFLNLCFQLTDWLLNEQQNRPADAKILLERAAKDPLTKEHPRAKQVLEEMLERAEKMLAGPEEEEPAEDEGEDEDEEESPEPEDE